MMRREDTLKEDKLNLINPSWIYEIFGNLSIFIIGYEKKVY